jgi:hypothetical protein
MYNNTDILVRLAHIRCYIASIAARVVERKKYGLANKHETSKMLLLNAYMTIIGDYYTTSTNNLITETDLDNIFNVISRITGLCFAPLGYAYFENVPVTSDSLILLNDGTSGILLNNGTDLIIKNS